MARFYGNIGFAVQEETEPGVFTENYVEKPYKGNVLRNSRRFDAGESTNDDLNINNTISVVGDSYLYSHIPFIRYVRWLGNAFKVTSVEIERPRLTLTLGGVFDGALVETS